MRHNIIIDGYAYKIRPVFIDDAQFIIDVRLEDEKRNRFLHKISPDIKDQEKWIEAYLGRKDDYYFVIENKLSSEPEGLIGIYSIENNKATWGRWVVKKGSLAAIESVDLMFKASFEYLNLEKVYSQTIIDNETVVSFHENIGAVNAGVIKNYFLLDEKYYDAVEHFVTKEHYFSQLQNVLEAKSAAIFQRNLRLLVGRMEFHHIAVATDNIEKEFEGYRMLGYTRESNVFEDNKRGIRVLFIVAPNQPRLELLENLPTSHVLDRWLMTRNKMYHFAYKVSNMESMIKVFNKNKIKMLSSLEQSTYFGKRICFLLLPNMNMIELIED